MSYQPDQSEPVECLSCNWAGQRRDCIDRDTIDCCANCGGPVTSLSDPPVILDSSGKEYDPMAVTPER